MGERPAQDADQELPIGVPLEERNDGIDRGRVVEARLGGARAPFEFQDTLSPSDPAETKDRFGVGLAR